MQCYFVGLRVIKYRENVDYMVDSAWYPACNHGNPVSDGTWGCGGPAGWEDCGS